MQKTTKPELRGSNKRLHAFLVEATNIMLLVLWALLTVLVWVVYFMFFK